VRTAIVLAAAALAVAATAGPPPRLALDRIGALLPERLGGKRVMSRGVQGGTAFAAYLERGDPVSININLLGVGSAKEIPGNRYLGKDVRERNEANRTDYRGLKVGGFPAVRMYSLTGSRKSEVNVLIAGKLQVNVAVQPTDDPDGAVPFASQLDLAGMAKIAGAK
jgi:hypothetical protein